MRTARLLTIKNPEQIAEYVYWNGKEIQNTAQAMNLLNAMSTDEEKTQRHIAIQVNNLHGQISRQCVSLVEVFSAEVCVSLSMLSVKAAPETEQPIHCCS